MRCTTSRSRLPDGSHFAAAASSNIRQHGRRLPRLGSSPASATRVRQPTRPANHEESLSTRSRRSSHDFVKFAEAIGLDPRTDIGEVVVFGDGFDETDATVVANLGSTTGNLEGWILAAPGYRSEDLDEQHATALDDARRARRTGLVRAAQTRVSRATTSSSARSVKIGPSTLAQRSPRRQCVRQLPNPMQR